jgi:hypothetical protein
MGTFHFFIKPALIFCPSRAPWTVPLRASTPASENVACPQFRFMFLLYSVKSDIRILRRVAWAAEMAER